MTTRQPSTPLCPPVLAALLALAVLSGASLAATPADLLPNGGFEDGLSGWQEHQITAQIVPAPVRSGSAAALLAVTAPAANGWLVSDYITVTSGHTLTLSGSTWVTDTRVAATQLRLVWYPDRASLGNSGRDDATTPVFPGAAAWQSFVPCQVTVPAGITLVKVQARVVLNDGSAAGQAAFDDLSLHAAPPATPTATPSPTRTATPTSTPTPTPAATTALPGDILISELQPHPIAGGSDGEWVEIHNRTAGAVTLSGWSLADNLGADPLPPFTLAPGGFAVIAADEAVFRGLYPLFSGTVVTVADGRLGNGLADDGDRLTLRDGHGTAIDALSYGSDVTVFDPPAPATAAGHSLERRPVALDTDTAADFADCGFPSPGEPPRALTPTPTATPSRTPTTTVTASPTGTSTATATPTATWPAGAVIVNEILPAPHAVDWDGDGQAGAEDEWVELYNQAGVAVDLGGWRLDDAADAGSPPYLLPAGTWIPAHGYALFLRRQTGLTLNNTGDTVRLLSPDSLVAGLITFGSAAYDHSFSRTAANGWAWDYPPSPGGPNVAPTPAPRNAPLPPAEVPIGQARGAARNASVAVRGIVTAPPGVFGTRVAYVEDASGGLRLQHWGRDLPSLAEGDGVYAEGRMTAVYGEVTLNVSAIVRLGPGQPLPPAMVPVAAVGVGLEGRLVRIAGRVARWDSDDIWLDDGAGVAQLRLREATGLDMPRLAAGQFLRVTGVVGQSNGRWLVLPRWPRDLSALPALLPQTGE